MFLVGHGYAPVVTVRDGQGNVAYQGPVVFLPQDARSRSFGVIKVPDAQPEQLGFEGLFLPTYGFTMQRGPFSQFPDALDPVLSLTPYHGDLGLDAGKPQSVYSLDKSKLKPFPSSDPERLGPDARIKLSPGQTVQLPDGLGSIRFDGVAPLGQAPGQPLPRQGHRARRGAARHRGPDGLAVHPPAPGLGPGLPRTTPGRGVPWSSWPDSTAAPGGDLAGEVDELERLDQDIGPPHRTHEESPA